MAGMVTRKWQPGPSEELLRSWLHVAPGEEFSADMGDGSATVIARGREWKVTWDDHGDVSLDGRHREQWSWELRRERTRRKEEAKEPPPRKKSP